MMPSDNDKKYMEWMRSQITAHQRNEVSLSELVGNLESIANQMESLSAEDRKHFIEYWGDLEQVNAITKDRSMQRPDEIAQKIVADAIAKLNQWIERVEQAV